MHYTVEYVSGLRPAAIVHIVYNPQSLDDRSEALEFSQRVYTAYGVHHPEYRCTFKRLEGEYQLHVVFFGSIEERTADGLAESFSKLAQDLSDFRQGESSKDQSREEDLKRWWDVWNPLV